MFIPLRNSEAKVHGCFFLHPNHRLISETFLYSNFFRQNPMLEFHHFFLLFFTFHLNPFNMGFLKKLYKDVYALYNMQIDS